MNRKKQPAIVLLLILALLFLAACTNSLKQAEVKPQKSKIKKTKEVKVSSKKEEKKPEATQTAAQPSKKPYAIIETEKGRIVIELFPEVAPKTVANFIKLANQGFYNGLTWHRVVPGFVIQGGDPLGNGTGGPGYTIEAEFNNKKHVKGTVAMARSADPNSAGSQFYITLAPQPHLDGRYTVFGQTVEGTDVPEKIVQGDHMQKITIEYR